MAHLSKRFKPVKQITSVIMCLTCMWEVLGSNLMCKGCFLNVTSLLKGLWIESQYLLLWQNFSLFCVWLVALLIPPPLLLYNPSINQFRHT
jgi:hypothetical protein